MYRADMSGRVLKKLDTIKKGKINRLPEYNECARIFKALGHHARIHIIEFLRIHQRCVHDIAEELHMGMSTVSRHLDILRNAGLVYTRKEGTFVFYAPVNECANTIISYIVATREKTWENNCSR